MPRQVILFYQVPEFERKFLATPYESEGKLSAIHKYLNLFVFTFKYFKHAIV